ncbi:uroporphyrinogen-III C-methyltransferase [Aromatoleum aromaticum]|uniref:uroporphyrinogen-III C-methyltransferase n=1 Tax=Aromatoleum aromaticum (strain DSM 19018 / LMG 30748 / EbN1) TaxID=76114 RepID=Q5P7W5_AROAE|nr:uroporphyrinogen-III C-methyltransferase [Aromatoleum aromaticum]NMG55488.1 uroporphyrinogen-III C-methyltransferase [Aromatoleum aromaticum]CAI06596.1 Uroporphyrinogen-III methylase, siroheme synthase, C-terminal domain [Aromatoleum aromaticum EbN1]
MSKNIGGFDPAVRGSDLPTRVARAGKVYLVGAGPGDPELLTLKAARLLAGAQAVVYDHLVGDGILELINPTARMIYAGKEAGHHALPQDQINHLLVQLARTGTNVVRLKGGDPFMFGRGGEEMEELLACGIECEIVPGITAACGIAACTGIPLTHRDHARSVIFTTGHLKDDTVNLDWPALARPKQTVVIYMGLAALEIICHQLMAHGLPADTPAAVIHAGTTDRQVIVADRIDRLVATARHAQLESPALIMIGSVVSLHSLAHDNRTFRELALTA